MNEKTSHFSTFILVKNRFATQYFCKWLYPLDLQIQNIAIPFLMGITTLKHELLNDNSTFKRLKNTTCNFLDFSTQR